MKDEIVSFLNQIKRQDNRCTASPYFYVIRTAMFVPTSSEYDYDRATLYDSCGCEEYESEEICIEKLMEDGLSEEDARSKAASFDNVYYRKIWAEKGMFLTETDAVDHLRLNHYHYSHDAHTYIKHAWRAPELEAFFKNLNEYFGVTDGQEMHLP